jgi:hypothetical protein
MNSVNTHPINRSKSGTKTPYPKRYPSASGGVSVSAPVSLIPVNNERVKESPIAAGIEMGSIPNGTTNQDHNVERTNPFTIITRGSPRIRTSAVSI